jgi:hypothetical protein
MVGSVGSLCYCSEAEDEMAVSKIQHSSLNTYVMKLLVRTPSLLKGDCHKNRLLFCLKFRKAVLPQSCIKELRVSVHQCVNYGNNMAQFDYCNFVNLI